MRFQSLVEKATEVELMKNRRLNCAGTGGPMKSGSQNYQGKGRFQNRRPYQRPAGRGFTSGSYRPMAGTTGDSGKQTLNREEKICDPRFIGLKGVWGEGETQCTIISVYSPCDMEGKRQLWADLLAWRNTNISPNWCFLGDFNAVRAIQERRGASIASSQYRREMEEFNTFIEEAELVDIPTAGKKFTWYRPNGQAMSRLDRFLVSNDWYSSWPDCVQEVLERDLFDHCPVLLRLGRHNWGPYPFPVLNCWIHDHRFKPFVETSWSSLQAEGWGAFVLKEKLKAHKEGIKRWNKEIFGDLNTKRKEVVLELNASDTMADEGTLNAEDIVRRKALGAEYWRISNLHESLLHQKSRLSWIKEGDANTKFFHAMVNWRRTKNSLVGLHINGRWSEEPLEIKNEVKGFFSQKFREEQWASPKLDGVPFRQLSQADNTFLTTSFDIDEVKETVWDCDGDKSPGPDGYNFTFIKSFWHILQDDFKRMIDEFHRNVHDAKRRSPTMVFKVDYEKAYDSVNWNFLLYMMRRMNFDVRWIRWIRVCISSSTLSVLVNGSPTEEFKMEKGLRQGDPMAPFLFLNVAEGLNGLLKHAVALEKYKPYKVGDENPISISLLQFANDTLFIGDGTIQNTIILKCILHCFELASGLKVNFSKSSLVEIAIDELLVRRMAAILHCRISKFPLVYLGIPLGGNPKSLRFWDSIILKIKKRLSKWKQKLLTFGGRLCLIKSNLSSLPLYFFSFKAPAGVLKESKKIVRRFLWGAKENENKLAWVSWSKICRPKEEGGLGVRDWGLFNKALLGKWRWRLLKDKDNLWSKVLHAKYKNTVPVDASSWWKDLNLMCFDEGLGGWMEDGLCQKIGEGNDTKFWHDNWLGSRPLRDIYVRLYYLSTQQNHTIEESLVDELHQQVCNFTLIEGARDDWVWNKEEGGVFTVKSAFEILLGEVTEPADRVFHKLWSLKAPSNTLSLAWKILLNRIQSKENLRRRGILNTETETCCSFCSAVEESTSHLIFTFAISWRIWMLVYDWLGM
ncbi:uncharacterized protein LOC130735191 [Lotus japonicus]|uniref:uncharacterized protein LOC130735191 n=1 Tax=Lotus japonicus TaxID=34305 RepID=UPI0025849E95|nr:uncharacterized protein LOC130735191 [Lotus japonicus]